MSEPYIFLPPFFFLIVSFTNSVRLFNQVVPGYLQLGAFHARHRDTVKHTNTPQ